MQIPSLRTAVLCILLLYLKRSIFRLQHAEFIETPDLEHGPVSPESTHKTPAGTKNIQDYTRVRGYGAQFLRKTCPQRYDRCVQTSPVVY